MVDTTQQTFLGSDARISLMLNSANYTGNIHPEDPSIHEMVQLATMINYENSTQIGSGDILHNVIEQEVSHLQRLDLELIKLDKTSESDLRTQEDAFLNERLKLSNELEDIQNEQNRQLKEEFTKLQNAPDKEAFANTFSRAAIANIGKKSSIFAEKIVNLLKNVVHAQQKSLDRYKSLYFKMEEYDRNALHLQTPGEFESQAQKSAGASRWRLLNATQGANPQSVIPPKLGV